MIRDWSYTLIFVAVVATFNSALSVGYNNGVINAPSEIIKQWIQHNIQLRYQTEITANTLDFLWSSIVAIFLVGGVIGSLFGGWLSNNYGRRNALIITSFLNIVGGISFFIAKPIEIFEFLILGRLLTGIAAGSITCVLPMYLIELAPGSLIGVMGVICPLGINIGLLCAQIFGLNYILGTSELWPYLLSLFIIVNIPTTVVLFFFPQSPKFLYSVYRDIEKVTKELKRLRNTNKVNISDEIRKIKDEFNQNSSEKKSKWSVIKVIKRKEFLLPLLLVCSLQAGQQLSGINSIFFYSVSIFKKNQLSETGAQLINIGTGVFNLIMSIVSIFTIKKFNRRIMMQISLIATIICLFLFKITIDYINCSETPMIICIVSLISYVIFYGLGLGPIPYFIGSELFETGPRPIAMGIGSMFNWGANFLVAITFPSIYNMIGSSSFLIFIIALILLTIFVWIYLPETRNSDLKEISEICSYGIKKFKTKLPITSLS